MIPDYLRPTTGRSPFGDALIRFRADRGLTQERLAAAVTIGQISPRSITNYEKKVDSPREWILPHSPSVNVLADALELDSEDRRALVKAWNASRKIRRDNEPEDHKVTSFVPDGRTSHIADVLSAWNRAQDGVPQLVLIRGVSGVGKTELARHVCDQIAASTPEVMIAWGGASGWATSVEPYLAFRTATDHIVSPPAATSSIPGRYASRPIMTEKNVQRFIDAIPLLGGALLSVTTLYKLAKQHNQVDEELIDAVLTERSSTETIGRFNAYGRLLIDLAQSWPIVIVLEDLHWAGDPTMTLLLHLIGQLGHERNTRILFICTYRTDELRPEIDTVPNLLTQFLNSIGPSSRVTRVKLNDAMAATEGQQFIKGLLRNTPVKTSEEEEHLADWLYQKTSGHPLLMGEMLRHLSASGALSLPVGKLHWKFRPEKLPADIPMAISDFIDQRFSRLNSDSRRILEIASVMNNTIFTGIIAAILNMDEGEVLELIETSIAEEHQLLLRGPSLPLSHGNHAVYQFPHALFREHIYAQLGDARRRRFHVAVGNAMEKRFPDPDTITLSEITSHYILAEDWPKAARSGFDLARQATARLDWDLATVWFTQAEGLALKARNPEQLWRARAASLSALRGTGNQEEAHKLGNQIVEIAAMNNWPEALALAHHYLGEVHYDLGNVDTAVDHLTNASKLHIKNGSLDLTAICDAMLSHATYRQGKYDIAYAHAQNALQGSRTLQNSWIRPEAMLAAANCSVDLGYYEQAIDHYVIIGELANMVGKLSNQYVSSMNIALCRIQMGQYQIAFDDLTKVIAQMESKNTVRFMAYAKYYLGLASERLQMWDHAKAAYDESATLRRTGMSAPTLIDSLAGTLRLSMREKDDDKVEIALSEIVTHGKQHGWIGIEDPLLAFVSVARAYARMGDDDAYEQYIRQGHELLMLRADLIESTDAAASYLTNVPISAELQTLYLNLPKIDNPR